MTDADRFRLHFGPYKTPRFRYGDVVVCDVRGKLTLCGLTDARTPWPIGKRGRARSIAVFGDLSLAIHRESAQAVAYWWGVDQQTVTVWRKALGVGPTTEGTVILRRQYAFEPWARKARRKAHAKSRDPVHDQERRAKISVAKRGQARPRQVVQAVIAAHRGVSPTEETRRKLSLAHRRRGTRPPKAGRAWTHKEDRLVKTLAPADVAKQTGKTLSAVYARRIDLGVPDGRKKVFKMQG